LIACYVNLFSSAFASFRKVKRFLVRESYEFYEWSLNRMHVDFADGEYESDHEDEELFELESRMSTP
jgi:hypothetical protein